MICTDRFPEYGRYFGMVDTEWCRIDTTLDAMVGTEATPGRGLALADRARGQVSAAVKIVISVTLSHVFGANSLVAGPAFDAVLLTHDLSTPGARTRVRRAVLLPTRRAEDCVIRTHRFVTRRTRGGVSPTVSFSALVAGVGMCTTQQISTPGTGVRMGITHQIPARGTGTVMVRTVVVATRLADVEVGVAVIFPTVLAGS